MTPLSAHATLATVSDSTYTDPTSDLVDLLILFALLIFVVIPGTWFAGALLATRSLKKWPSLVAETEQTMYRWATVVGAVPWIGPFVYALFFFQARYRCTPEQLVVARMTHRARAQQAHLAGRVAASGPW